MSTLDDVRIEAADDDQINALYSIMALAGEHMHRVLGLSHWHPFPSSEAFAERLANRDLFAVYKGDFLVGTFNISQLPEPYYTDDMSAYWAEPESGAMYFSGFALLPAFQQMGIGSYCMAQADAMIRERGYRWMRFDAVASHPKLVHFYTRLGYRQCGELMVRDPLAVMCFEKDLSA